MKNQPHNIRYPEAVKVLEHFGYQLVRTNGSHRHFRNSEGALITVKEDKPTIKRAYVEDILIRIGE
ncbi:type II toxin-antitoxin system HicA family toxin [Cohnella panacarvi]|uniref:type II toxin-antitoxin system HicA family toxin n=1 Tax=Cohnella panacarvi TaxID=400776 RepID=UPI001FDF9C7C|nr:type II toxin-antitoxin system HicA family toxin [Cohnella panacarvi]